MSNSFDPDAARRCFGPNCLQMLSADDIGRGIVNQGHGLFYFTSQDLRAFKLSHKLSAWGVVSRRLGGNRAECKDNELVVKMTYISFQE